MKSSANSQKLLFGLLALTLLATAFLASQEEPADADAIEVVSKPHKPAVAISQPIVSSGLPVLIASKAPALDADNVADLFKSRIVSAKQIAAEKAAAAEAAEPAPAPQAPPLPFIYLGQVNENGKTVYFLSREQLLYTVHAGDMLDGQYRLDEGSQSRLEFTYLPLNMKQTLTLPMGAS